MTKKMKSSYDELIESMSPEELIEFNEEFKKFALSELILALQEGDEISVSKLIKLADISPTIVQEMRSKVKNN